MKIIVNMTVPEAVERDGKTGSLVRLVEMFKYFKRSDDEIDLVFNVTEWMANYFKKNSVDAHYRILSTGFKFKGYVGLCLKSIFLMIRSFSVFGIPRMNAQGERIIVYASSDLFWEVIPAFVYKLKNSRIEWVQIIHHIYPDWKKRPGSKVVNFFGFYLQRFSFLLIRKKADKIILMNNFVQDGLLQIGFNAEKMHVLSNGIDLDYFNTLKRTEVSYEGVFLGRLGASKGISDLIPICKKVCEKIPSVRLAIIGGSEKNAKIELIQKIKNQGLEKNVDVLGFLEDEKAFPILKAAKVFIFPSHEEGWGIAIAQAMACGLPVVSWNLPVYREIFEGYTLQVKENDLDAFADYFLRLLSDNDYRKKVGSKGKEFIKKYSWEEVARKELEIIKT